jgi:hypothetical protein
MRLGKQEWGARAHARVGHGYRCLQGTPRQVPRAAWQRLCEDEVDEARRGCGGVRGDAVVRLAWQVQRLQWRTENHSGRKRRGKLDYFEYQLILRKGGEWSDGKNRQLLDIIKSSAAFVLWELHLFQHTTLLLCNVKIAAHVAPLTLYKPCRYALEYCRRRVTRRYTPQLNHPTLNPSHSCAVPLFMILTASPPPTHKTYAHTRTHITHVWANYDFMHL